MANAVRTMVIFPYRVATPQVFELMASVLENARARGLHTAVAPPLLVVHEDSHRAKNYEKFTEYLQTRTRPAPEYIVEFVGAVDTCQLWLSGWWRILNDNKATDTSPVQGVLQIPGDLTEILPADPLGRRPFDEFLGRLKEMRLALEDAHFVVGDFKVDQEQAKQLIDTYGTFPLLYLWFPEVATKLRAPHLDIKRPRTEFIAARLDFLEEFTGAAYRKFAYEETLALLIHALPRSQWVVEKRDIGIVRDFGGDRGFAEALAQIERTERMLRVLWREVRGLGRDLSGTEARQIIAEYANLDAESTSIRVNARVCCSNFLLPEVTTVDASMSSEERNKLLELFDRSKTEFLDAVDGATGPQWTWKPHSGSWSITEIAEHIMLAEADLFATVLGMLESPASSAWERETRGKTELIEWLVPSGAGAAKAPASTQPGGRLSLDDIKKRFIERRSQIVSFSEATRAALKQHTANHPFPGFATLNAYHWLLYLPLHTLRHTKQIAQVKGTPGFPS